MTSNPQVQTVRGPAAVGDLGTVLIHEHVFVVGEELRRSLPETWDEQERVDDAVTRLKALAAAGVSTLVDCTVIGLGRDVARVARVNAQVDLDIVAATGIHTPGDIPAARIPARCRSSSSPREATSQACAARVSAASSTRVIPPVLRLLMLFLFRRCRRPYERNGRAF
ncbi:phosphotriesterase family protein [Streptomyces sp. NPDC001100]